MYELPRRWPRLPRPSCRDNQVSANPPQERRQFQRLHRRRLALWRPLGRPPGFRRRQEQKRLRSRAVAIPGLLERLRGVPRPRLVRRPRDQWPGPPRALVAGRRHPRLLPALSPRLNQHRGATPRHLRRKQLKPNPLRKDGQLSPPSWPLRLSRRRLALLLVAPICGP